MVFQLRDRVDPGAQQWYGVTGECSEGHPPGADQQTGRTQSQARATQENIGEIQI